MFKFIFNDKKLISYSENYLNEFFKLLNLRAVILGVDRFLTLFQLKDVCLRKTQEMSYFYSSNKEINIKLYSIDLRFVLYIQNKI